MDRVCTRLSSVFFDRGATRTSRTGHQRTTPILCRLFAKVSSFIDPCQTCKNHYADTPEYVPSCHFVSACHTNDTYCKAVYGEEGRINSRFLASIKNALKCLASINDERDSGFPLNLKDSSSSISRLSAYLHLFHHQVRHSLPLRCSIGQANSRNSAVHHPYHQTIVVCLVAEKSRDISAHAHQLGRERTILAPGLCRVRTRNDENPRGPSSSKPSRYV